MSATEVIERTNELDQLQAKNANDIRDVARRCTALDCSATRWMAREISARRDAAREFFIRNQDRILFGSDQVSTDDRGFDFLASRFWVHRKLWETAYIGPNPILDPDLPADQQPQLRGLALPDDVLQKLYHDNATKFLARLGVGFDPAAGVRAA